MDPHGSPHTPDDVRRPSSWRRHFRPSRVVTGVLVLLLVDVLVSWVNTVNRNVAELKNAIYVASRNEIDVPTESFSLSNGLILGNEWAWAIIGLVIISLVIGRMVRSRIKDHDERRRAQQRNLDDAATTNPPTTPIPAIPGTTPPPPAGLPGPPPAGTTGTTSMRRGDFPL